MQEGATILLVEDEPHIREAVSRLLAAAGFRTVVASHGEEALDLAARAPEICLVVTDIRLPDMYGRRLAERLVEARPAVPPRLPFIYMSGHPAEIALDAPPSAHERFLQKPFELEDLLTLVRQLLAPPA